MNDANMMNDDLIQFHRQSLEQDFRRAALWAWIERQLSAGRALDVGGGSGYMTQRLLLSGYDTTLAEPDAELVDFSRTRLRTQAHLQIVRQRAEELAPEELGVFENILCLDVLEHIEDDVAAIRNIARLISPNGRLVISVPAMPQLYGQRDVAYGHFRRHTRATLRQLIESADLELEKLRYWNLLGVLPYFIYEKILQRPINDDLRRKQGGPVSNVLRNIIYEWLRVETHLPLPFGLSLLAVTRRCSV
ncbi:MAG: class I SAM-dependent methyltransferase [Anaerolineae bacterium]|nr:class I SAM-dependent methyltransferase [Anaerolineae bacterium]